MNKASQIKPYGRAWLADFGLDPEVLHANHGSYGAVPAMVRASHDAWLREMRRNPAGFFRRTYPAAIREAADHVAHFLGGEGDAWAFVENATDAANAVLASVTFGPGDEILTTNQAYGAVRKAIAHWCARSGAKLVEAKITLPVAHSDEILKAISNAATDRTKLVVVDHIASPCGVVFPIEDICAVFRVRDVPVFVDGAHTPGNIGIDVGSLGADFFAGNAHKWLCSPHGAGVFWCRESWQDRVHPTVISHGYGAGFTQEFDWVGTRDPCPWLSVPAAIDFHLSAGGETLRRRNRDLAFEAAAILSEEFGTELVAPPVLQSSMATVRLPTNVRLDASDHDRLHVAVEERERAIVAINSADSGLWLRLSAAIYNEIDDLIAAGRKARKVVDELYGP